MADNVPDVEKSHSELRAVEFDLDELRQFDPSCITVEAVEPVHSRFHKYGGACILLRNTITREECKYLIKEMGRDMKPVQYRHDYRRNDRCVFDSRNLADLLWERIRPFAEEFVVCVDPDPARQRLLGDDFSDDCPDALRLGYGSEGAWHPNCLNECLRFCRYQPGGFFRAHCDGCFQRSEDERSLFTCMFYLDGDFEGGATRFLDIDSTLKVDTYLKIAAEDQVLATVVAEPGLCILFFQQGLLHEGADLQGGVKHILRTDVMCRRDPATKMQRTPQQLEAMKLVNEAQKAEADHECDKAASLYRRAFKMDPNLERMF